jgi:hypothetical protein
MFKNHSEIQPKFKQSKFNLSKTLSLLITIISYHHELTPRNYFRGIDPAIPYIEVQWADQTAHQSEQAKYLEANPNYTLRDSHLKERPLFHTFDRIYFEQKLLPRGPIPYRNSPQKKLTNNNSSSTTESVLGETLSAQVENLLHELHELNKLSKKERMRIFKTYFTDFTILKSNEFYFKSFSGLIIAKFKKYPFVVKLLIEKPASITMPYNRGIYSMGIFTLSGTVRHTIGFSRIINSENIMAKAATHPRWKDRLTLPKKWFWLPKNPSWLKITGHNIGIHGTQSIEVPAIYAVIAEEINCSDTNCKPNPRECLEVSNFLQCATDPNYSNFRIEDSTGKLAIIDTESFPLLMGLDAEQIRPFKSYKGFYSRVTIRFVHRKLFQDKRARRKNQFKDQVIIAN